MAQDMQFAEIEYTSDYTGFFEPEFDWRVEGTIIAEVRPGEELGGTGLGPIFGIEYLDVRVFNPDGDLVFDAVNVENGISTYSEFALSGFSLIDGGDGLQINFGFGGDFFVFGANNSFQVTPFFLADGDETLVSTDLFLFDAEIVNIVPAPGVASVLGIAGLAAVRRRR